MYMYRPWGARLEWDEGTSIQPLRSHPLNRPRIRSHCLDSEDGIACHHGSQGMHGVSSKTRDKQPNALGRRIIRARPAAGDDDVLLHPRRSVLA